MTMQSEGTMQSESEPAAAACQTVDVVVIGAGLAGTCAAIVLAKAGRKVALIDARAVYPNEFRAEKLGMVHMALFEKLGLGDTIKPLMTPMDDIRVYRFGKPFSSARVREYGFSYAGLINGLRAAMPAQVNFVVGKVADIEAGPGRQRVTLADGSSFDARLVVMATGLGDAVRRSVGIRRIESVKAHSLSLGFTLAQPAAAYPFETLTYYGRDPADRVAYLTLFPIDGAMRANFFVYRTAADAWTKAFRQHPQEMLRELMPEIAGLCGDFAIDGHVEVRQIDLLRTEGYRRDGVVLLGDAFCTTCPAPGVGIMRVMTDVDRLCSEHLPRWFETQGMPVDKIAMFYDDPVKQAMDAKGIGASLYSRNVATETGPVWMARRVRNNVARRLLYWAGATGHGVRSTFDGPSMTG